MDGDLRNPCAFEKLFTKNVPHILEHIFFSLDYTSYKTCLNVNTIWHKLLTSKRYLKRGRFMYKLDLSEEHDELLKASKEGRREEVKRILSNQIVDVNYRKYGFVGYIGLRKTEDGYSWLTPLKEAVTACNINVTVVLLCAGADPNEIDETDKENYLKNMSMRSRAHSQTYLYLAAREGHLNVVQFYLNLGEDCNLTSCLGDTYLHAAAKRGQVEMVKLLLDRGADPNKTDKYGLTPLDEALRKGYKDVVKQLLVRGAKRGKYPLMYRRHSTHTVLEGRKRLSVAEEIQRSP